MAMAMVMPQTMPTWKGPVWAPAMTAVATAPMPKKHIRNVPRNSPLNARAGLFMLVLVPFFSVDNLGNKRAREGKLPYNGIAPTWSTAARLRTARISIVAAMEPRQSRRQHVSARSASFSACVPYSFPSESMGLVRWEIHYTFIFDYVKYSIITMRRTSDGRRLSRAGLGPGLAKGRGRFRRHKLQII